MVKFIMLVGLPASGKSTMAKKLKEENKNSIILSSDELRIELFNNVNDIEHNGQVFEEMNKRTKQYLKQGITVIYDATNISSKRRMNLLKQFNKIDCFKECCFIFEPYSTCIYRDKIRYRTVGEDVIRRMRNGFNVPQYYEGWDNIIVKYNKTLERYENKLIDNINTYDDYLYLLSSKKYLEKCIEMPQDNPHHTFSLSRHMYKTYEFVKNRTTNKNLIIASLFHDIGKSKTKEFREDGYAHYYNHDNISAQLIMLYLIRETNIDIKDILYICGLIQLHMRMFNIEGYEKLRKQIGINMFNDLLLLHNADIQAK